MMALYRVKDWNTHFENHKSRALVKLDWVPMPNKMDGDGYTELVDHPDGASHFGIWCALVMVASKCQPRGTLARSGGGAHDCVSLARVTRLPSDAIASAIARFVKIGWLESSGAEASESDGGASESGAEASVYARVFPSFPSVQFPSVHADFEERFSAAWDRHKKHRGGVTRQMVAQRLLDVDWDAWDARHVPFCEFWDRAGWPVCTLGMLEWHEQGMPLPPKEATRHKSDVQPEKPRAPEPMSDREYRKMLIEGGETPEDADRLIATQRSLQ